MGLMVMEYVELQFGLAQDFSNLFWVAVGGSRGLDTILTVSGSRDGTWIGDSGAASLNAGCSVRAGWCL